LKSRVSGSFTPQGNGTLNLSRVGPVGHEPGEESLIRRLASTFVAPCSPLAAWLVVLATLGGTALAAPSVSLKAKFVPIPGTRMLSGSEAALQLEYAIAGSGYGATPQRPGGGVPPLAAIDLSLPEGVTLASSVPGTCSNVTLLNTGPQGCTRSSSAGSLGRATGEVSFGSERVPEELLLQSFFTAGGLSLYFQGSSPVSLESIAPTTAFGVSNGAPYGLELRTELPAITTVPGAPLVSFDAIGLKLGALFTAGGGTSSYVTLPPSCPSGGLPLRAKLTFGGSYGGEREFGIAAETVTATYVAPCPSSLPPAVGEAIPGTGGAVTAPSNKVCVSRRDFRIHVLQIKGLTYRRVAVDVNGRRVKTVRGRRTSAQVDLRGLPKARYTVRITVTTSTGRSLSGIRAYHTCAPKPLPGGRPRL
jgi:hypothetical protein